MAKIVEEVGFAACKVVATGGLAHGLAEYSRYIEEIEPNLTLDGLRIIGESN